jgi:hypothetical protein
MRHHTQHNDVQQKGLICDTSAKCCCAECRVAHTSTTHRGHYVIVPNVTVPNITFPNVTIPKLVKIQNINRNPAIPPLYMPEASIACQVATDRLGQLLMEKELS